MNAMGVWALYMGVCVFRTCSRQAGGMAGPAVVNPMLAGTPVGPVSDHPPPTPRPCLQAALSPRPAGPDTPPTGGDGFTFEHLADKEELWWDFVADTGDGGDPTYA